MSNNPGSTTYITIADKMPYTGYEIRDLILYAYWEYDFFSKITPFSGTVMPPMLGKWLKDHGAELIAGQTWRLPSEEIKVLFLLRWS